MLLGTEESGRIGSSGSGSISSRSGLVKGLAPCAAKFFGAAVTLIYRCGQVYIASPTPAVHVNSIHAMCGRVLLLTVLGVRVWTH